MILTVSHTLDADTLRDRLAALVADPDLTRYIDLHSLQRRKDGLGYRFSGQGFTQGSLLATPHTAGVVQLTLELTWLGRLAEDRIRERFTELAAAHLTPNPGARP